MYVIGVKLKYYFITIFTVTAILCLQVSNAEAISKRTVHDFTIYCQEKHALYPYCNGIVEGILYILEVNSRTESSFQICLPEDGLTIPQIILIKLVFPAPFGPSIARISPCLTSRLTSLRALNPLS